jgi:hypothetical protein
MDTMSRPLLCHNFSMLLLLRLLPCCHAAADSIEFEQLAKAFTKKSRVGRLGLLLLRVHDSAGSTRPCYNTVFTVCGVP